MQPNLWFRVIFNWASKVAWRCLGFALLRKVTDPQKLAPSSQLIRSVFKNQTGFGHPRLITREKFACFDFEFSLAIRSLSKYQTRFGYTRLIAREAVSSFSLWVLIGYPICFQNQTQFGLMRLIAREQFAGFHFEFSLAACDICLNSDWPLWLLWFFDFRHGIKIHFTTNSTETLTRFSFIIWIRLRRLGYFHIARLEWN